MKKILILLFSLVSLCASAQNGYSIWYTADAVNFDDGNEVKEDFEGWRECDIRVLRTERVVKIFLEETLCLIGIEDRYERTTDEEGNIYMTKKCVDGNGTECTVSFLHDKHDRYILLLLEYKNYTVCYHVVQD